MSFALEVFGANSLVSFLCVFSWLKKKQTRHEELNSCLCVTIWRELQSLEKLFVWVVGSLRLWNLAPVSFQSLDFFEVGCFSMFYYFLPEILHVEWMLWVRVFQYHFSLVDLHNLYTWCRISLELFSVFLGSSSPSVTAQYSHSVHTE